VALNPGKTLHTKRPTNIANEQKDNIHNYNFAFYFTAFETTSHTHYGKNCCKGRYLVKTAYVVEGHKNLITRSYRKNIIQLINPRSGRYFGHMKHIWWRKAIYTGL
jgi:hypothetical protein